MGRGNTEQVAGEVGASSERLRPFLALLYVRLLVVLAGALLCLLIYAQLFWPSLHPPGAFPWISFGLLLLLACFAELYTIRVGPGMEISAGFLACFLSAAVAGPLASFCIAVASQLLGLRQRQWERTICFTATMGLVAGGASFLYWTWFSLVGGFAEAPVVVVAAFSLGAGILYQILNYILGVPIVWLNRGIGFKRAWVYGVVPFLKFDLFFLVVSVGLISIYHLYLPRNGGAASPSSALLVVLCLVPVVALVWALRQWAVERMLAHRNERLALQAVASQVTALDLKDNYTARHSASVAQWAKDIARGMGLSESDQNLSHLAGVLHDVGKIGVPDEILKSSSRLNADNWAQIERHCENGYKVLRTIDQFEELATVVLHHHERYDGSGYPRGLAGEDIPLISRIICVADSYSAMTSQRPYGPPLATEVAIAELEYQKGTQFDPVVVDAFLAILAEHDEAYQRGLDVDFDTEVHRIRFLQDLPVELTDADITEETLGDAPPSLEGALPQMTTDPRVSDRD
jgi:putative nucleotidyltransferase with HDIG domain